MNASGSGIGLNPLMMALGNTSNPSNGEGLTAVEPFSTVLNQYQMTPLATPPKSSVGELSPVSLGQPLPLVRQQLSWGDALSVADLLSQREGMIADDLAASRLDMLALSATYPPQAVIGEGLSDALVDVEQTLIPIDVLPQNDREQTILDQNVLDQNDASALLYGSLVSTDSGLASSASVVASAQNVTDRSEYRAPTAAALNGLSSDEWVDGQRPAQVGERGFESVISVNTSTQAHISEAMTQQDSGAWQASMVLENNLATSSLKASAAEVSLQQQLSQAEARLSFGRDTEQWTPALGGRILAMVEEGIQHARIHLDPPELGSLEIRMRIQHDQATVQIQVQTPQVRDVLESQAQRLRDALAEQGLQLASFDVSEQGQQGFAGQTANADWEQEGDGELSEDNDGGVAVKQPTHNGLLDTYA